MTYSKDLIEICLVLFCGTSVFTGIILLFTLFEKHKKLKDKTKRRQETKQLTKEY